MVELIGIAAGVLTTLCWLPQALRILRSEKREGHFADRAMRA